MYTIRKKFKFEYAHQLTTCFSECCKQCIHGHSAILEVFFQSETLNKDGMVIDFGEVKERLKNLVNKFDHALIMSDKFEKEYLDILKKYNKKIIIVNYNPTSEEMSKMFYNQIKGLIIGTNITLQKVRLHETDTGYAEYFEN
jgi:6-pyruvoyltetrahydropterin/6-carboxytetrahydropterin synthase